MRCGKGIIIDSECQVPEKLLRLIRSCDCSGNTKFSVPLCCCNNSFFDTEPVDHLVLMVNGWREKAWQLNLYNGQPWSIAEAMARMSKKVLQGKRIAYAFVALPGHHEREIKCKTQGSIPIEVQHFLIPLGSGVAGGLTGDPLFGYYGYVQLANDVFALHKQLLELKVLSRNSKVHLLGYSLGGLSTLAIFNEARSRPDISNAFSTCHMLASGMTFDAVRDFYLNPIHPLFNRDMTAVFKRALGFRREQFEGLTEQLQQTLGYQVGEHHNTRRIEYFRQFILHGDRHFAQTDMARDVYFYLPALDEIMLADKIQQLFGFEPDSKGRYGNRTFITIPKCGHLLAVKPQADTSPHQGKLDSTSQRNPNAHISAPWPDKEYARFIRLFLARIRHYGAEAAPLAFEAT